MDNSDSDFFSWIYGIIGRFGPMPRPHFNEDQIVSYPEQFTIYTGRKYVKVPQQTAVVITSVDGKQEVYLEGRVIRRPIGPYDIQYIDMKQRTTRITNIRAKSSDAWDVLLSIDVTWQVKNPLVVLKGSEPFQTLCNLCRSATVDFIQSKIHDNLVASPGAQPLPESEISAGILERISVYPAVRGFTFHNINVIEKRGDPKRIYKLEAAMVRKTEQDSGLLLELERLQGQIKILQEQLNLTKEQGILYMQEATNIKEVSQTKAETEAGVSKIHADAEAYFAEIRLPIEAQRARLQRYQNAQQIDHAEVMKEMDTFGEIMKEFAQALANMPNLGSNVPEEAFKVFLANMQTLNQIARKTDADDRPQLDPPDVRPIIDR
jgi:hypothetical protein